MTKELGVQVRMPSRYPDEGKRYKLEAARRQVGDNLFKFLWESKLPAVIDVEEVIANAHPDDPYGEDVIEYRVRSTPVRHRHIVVPVLDEINFNFKLPKKAKFWDKLKFLLS